ncbi:MAG TPA: methyltransferase domain-containing protein, partial [Ramlibacter sp.]|nr:methyltransferase domain-containing protein [Ramlibacter sp.]
RRRGLRFVEASAERLPFPDGHFDRAMMLRSFHHMPDQEAALRELRRVLKPGGSVLVQELDPTTQPGHFVHWFENRLLRQECHFHAGEDLPPLLKRAGFEVGPPERAVRGYFLVARRP